MCNLYSITTNQEAIRALFRVMNRYVGNLPAMPVVFPDYPAPVVRNAGAERELVLMRWGMPPPLRTGWAASDQHPQHVIAALARLAEARKPMPGAFQQLCRVCARAEPRDQKKDVVWFAINDDRPLTCFAGIWTEFKGERGTKSKPIPGPHQVYDHVAERRRRTDPPEGHAGHPADGGGARRLDARAVGRSQGATAAAADDAVTLVMRGGDKEDRAAA
jgi:hypothetical protein